MNYFFILGSHPALSLSELVAKINGQWQVINDSLAIVSGVTDLSTDLLESLGGTIKFGQIIENKAINFSNGKVWTKIKINPIRTPIRNINKLITPVNKYQE